MKNLVLTQTTEGTTRLLVPDLVKYKQPEFAPVFYNPRMKADRDVSVALLPHLLKRKARVLDLLCGLGARSVRYARECGFSVTANDVQPSAVALARKNALLNKVKLKSSVSEANKFLIDHKDDKFDCVDIDPFGSPAEFVQNAFQALQPKNSVLAVTATDLGALSGGYPEAGFRKYALVARESPFLHELGVRNLIAYCYEQAARQDLIVVPVMSYYNKHYYRVFLKLMGSGKKQAREH